MSFRAGLTAEDYDFLFVGDKAEYTSRLNSYLVHVGKGPACSENVAAFAVNQFNIQAKNEGEKLELVNGLSLNMRLYAHNSFERTFFLRLVCKNVESGNCSNYRAITTSFVEKNECPSRLESFKLEQGEKDEAVQLWSKMIEMQDKIESLKRRQTHLEAMLDEKSEAARGRGHRKRRRLHHRPLPTRPSPPHLWRQSMSKELIADPCMNTTVQTPSPDSLVDRDVLWRLESCSFAN